MPFGQQKHEYQIIRKEKRKNIRENRMYMKKNILTKMAAIAVSGAMAIMTTIPVIAATDDIIDTARAASLTIYKYDLTAAQQGGVDIGRFSADGEADSAAQSILSEYALQGVGFTILNVAEISTVSESGGVQILYDLPDNLDQVLSMTTEAHTSDEINNALASALSTDNTTVKNALEEYVVSNGGTVMSETDENGMTKASGLTQGLYLIVETVVPDQVYYTTDPFFVSLPMTDATGDYWVYDVYAYPKNQTNSPTINKLVSENGSFGDTATASEGDVLDYRIVSQLPTITSRATWLSKYTIEDTVSSGLAFNKDVEILFYSSEADAKNGTGTPVDVWSEEGTYFTVSYGTSDMTIDITESGLNEINNGYSDAYLVVAYSATLRSDADTMLGDSGNQNSADLTYSRSNVSYTNSGTIEDVTNVYTYGLNLTKSFSADGGDATEVQFVLKNTSDDYWVTAAGSEGVYYVTGQATSESDATRLSPDTNGSLIVNGLEADTYELTEIQTSDGFALLKEPVTITFTQTVDSYIPSVASASGNSNEAATVSHVSDASVTVDSQEVTMSSDSSSANGRADINVVNNPSSFTLPQTGGLGTILFTLAGAVAVILGGAVIFKSRKNTI